MREVILNEHISQLGESIFFDKDLDRISFVDILSGEILAMKIDGTELEKLCSLPYVSAFKRYSKNMYIATSLNILYFLDVKGQILGQETIPNVSQYMRANDIGIHESGEIYVGIMHLEGNQDGFVCKRSKSGTWTIFIEDIGIPNTLLWDYSLGRFYFADSKSGKIYVSDKKNYDSPKISKPQYEIFCEAGALKGTPDGSVLDLSGNIWNARWDGNSIGVISPSGEIKESIEISAQRPTSCAFDLSGNLLISTANTGISDRQSADGKILSINLEKRYD